MRTAVFVSGGGTNLQALIDGIRSGRITNSSIDLVVSSKENVYALERAEKEGIPSEVISPKNFREQLDFDHALLECMKRHQIDLIILAGYLVILPKILVTEYAGRIINVHPSLIPSFCGGGYYGLKIHRCVLERGNKVTGATVHFVDEGTDTGPIISQKAVEVKEEDTPESLQLRVMQEAEWVLLPEAVDDIANNRLTIRDGKVYRNLRETEDL